MIIVEYVRPFRVYWKPLLILITIIIISLLTLTGLKASIEYYIIIFTILLLFVVFKHNLFSQTLVLLRVSAKDNYLYFEAHNKRLRFYKNSVFGYKCYNFHGGEGADLIRLIIQTPQEAIVAAPIAIDYLDREEKQSLLTYLDELIGYNKRTHQGIDARASNEQNLLS